MVNKVILMTDEEILKLASAANIIPWKRFTYTTLPTPKLSLTRKEFVHVDDGMDGDIANLLQFAYLVIKKHCELNNIQYDKREDPQLVEHKRSMDIFEAMKDDE